MQTFAIKPGDAHVSLLTYAGEVIPSLRVLLKRYAYSRSYGVFNAVEKRIMPTYPQWPGYQPDGTETVDGLPYCVAVTTPLAWVISAFVGYRGGIRVLGTISGEGTPNPGALVMANVGLSPADDQFQRISAPVPATPLAESIRLANNSFVYEDVFCGASMTHPRMQPSCNVEIPYYSALKFLNGRRRDQLGTGAAAAYTAFQTVTTLRGGTSVSDTFLNLFFAVGEDFQVGFYVGPPIMYELEQAPSTLVRSA
jgi:hypothetical protein